MSCPPPEEPGRGAAAPRRCRSTRWSTPRSSSPTATAWPRSPCGRSPSGSGVGAMSLYTYVAGRDDLVVLMVDQAFGRTGLPPMSGDLRARLTAGRRGPARRLPRPPVAARRDRGPALARPARRAPVRVAALGGRGGRPRRRRDGPDGHPGRRVRRHRRPRRGVGPPYRAPVGDDRPGVVGGQRRGAGRAHGARRLPALRPGRRGRGRGLPGGHRPAARARVRARPDPRRHRGVCQQPRAGTRHGGPGGQEAAGSRW